MNEPLHIAMLALHSSPLGTLGSGDTGGMSVYVTELGRSLGNQGNRIDIFTRDTRSSAFNPVNISANVRLIGIDVPGTRTLVKDELYNYLPSYQYEIERFCREQRESYHCVHSNYWLSAVVGDRLKKRWGCPHLITFHTFARSKMAARKDHREGRLRIEEEDRLLACSDGVMVATAAERDQYDALLDSAETRVYVAPLGVDLDHFKPLPAQPAVHGRRRLPPRILFVGRFDAMKGIDTAITALTHIDGSSRPELVLVGGDGRDSGSRRRLERLVRDLQLEDRVHFAGRVEHQRMPDMYRQADMVVVPSYYESFGLVVLEALATGIPVAATETGIAAEVIVPGVNGYLSAAGDSRSLAGAINDTLKLAKRQDGMIIRRSVQNYGWPQVADSVYRAYSDALLRRRGV
jgi:D-inositol-3-phosphate glycosyltransferase